MSTENAVHYDENVKTDTRKKLDEPARYKVLLHNDDFTTMEFVISILLRIFHKEREEAFAIMMNVHKNGIGKCGTYTREIAETKVNQVLTDARLAGFPLNCTMEKE